MQTLTKLSIASALAIASSGAFATDYTGVNPQVVPFLKAIENAPPLEKMSPADARQVLVGAQKGAALPQADVSEKVIKVDGKDVKLHIVRPAGAKGTLPAFMFFHGGGWVLGDFPTHERLVRDLVVNSGAAAVFVDYTPSPEAGYGVAINQAYGATKWVAAHGKEINVDGSHLAVAGNSVGGNMAAVVALMAKEQGQPKLRAQVLLWPVTDANFNTGSYQQFDNGYFLTRNMMKWFWDNYTTSEAARNEIHASPLRATVDQLKGLPPALVQTAEFDVLRDEGEAYARKLEEAGVPVTSTRYNGLIHDYGLLNPISSVPAVQGALRQAGAELAYRLK
ncbi:alpha/beta hydrolase fold domain-containing protein [Pseudoduganella sp. FT55W]|uniref:Alpha/beta hydrolase fold domain-containing protein n=1 Tax=Duganella rivi TaxID=2666083 RepID=A0A7X4GT96_9BURK|nr:alpha/beta hydrolase [Duganella rivi]MYM68237.1 alpha/beta hydrolase fold domain-containing protein [Duganella rivi]